LPSQAYNLMKHLLLLLLMILPSVANCQTVDSSNCELRWCTFNIRLKNRGDSKAGYGWKVRRDRVADYIRSHHIDVVGMQEVLHSQLKNLRKRLPEYDYVGVGRTNGKKRGEYSPIFFLKKRFEVLEKGNFWLSETPDVPGSVGWDAALERIASYAKLRDRETGKVFMAVNTHFDHVGVKAREESAKLIMSKIQEIVGEQPAVVTGDFNVTEKNRAYTTMLGCEAMNGEMSDCKLHDAYHMTSNRTGADYTYHGFCKIPPQKCEKIDFIFLTPTIRVNRSHIEQPNPEALLSDHNPHWVDLEF